MDPTWTLHGPINGPYYFLALCRLFIDFLFPLNVLDYRFGYLGTKFGNRGPSWHFMVPQMDPKCTPKWTLQCTMIQFEGSCDHNYQKMRTCPYLGTGTKSLINCPIYLPCGPSMVNLAIKKLVFMSRVAP